MIRLTDKRITDGKNFWYVTGIVKHGEIVLDTIHGDITKPAALRAALVNLIASKPRYRRYVQP